MAGCAGVPTGILLETDAGGAGDDAGTTPDSGQALPDSGEVVFDAGPTEVPDAGLTEFDAGPPPFDAGPPPFDGGPPPPVDAGTDLGDSVPNSAPTCTSGITWFLGNVGTDLMHPGQACINCHSMHNAPTFTFAGTVYPSTHEPDDCNGLGSGWQVIITDAAGKTITLTPNLVGSFRSSEAFTPPYTAQVVANGRTREMFDPQVSGDCNSCHTQNGANNAPGRIVAP
jgi:hypothetical protein